MPAPAPSIQTPPPPLNNDKLLQMLADMKKVLAGMEHTKYTREIILVIR